MLPIFNETETNTLIKLLQKENKERKQTLKYYNFDGSIHRGKPASPNSHNLWEKTSSAFNKTKMTIEKLVRNKELTSLDYNVIITLLKKSIKKRKDMLSEYSYDGSYYKGEVTTENLKSFYESLLNKTNYLQSILDKIPEDYTF